MKMDTVDELDDLKKLKLSDNADDNYGERNRAYSSLGSPPQGTSSNRMGSLSADNSPENNSPMYSSTESWTMAMDFLYSGSPPCGSQCGFNYHHWRPRSKRGYLQCKKNYLEEDHWDIGDQRPRVSSMPAWLYRNSAKLRTIGDLEELSRVRSFTITQRGVVNEGNYYVNRSTGSIEAACVEQDSPSASQALTKCASQPQKPYKVMVVGSPGVGKNSLIKNFLNIRTESSGCSSFDDEAEKCVSILLDGKESAMQFMDFSDNTQLDDEMKQSGVDAYVVVYSVEDRRSFEAAINRLHEIREEEDGRYVASILVANKTDLVRCRMVQEEEGRAAAKMYDSKYIEVSAAIDHEIDDLLVGVLKQIRLYKKKYYKSKLMKSGCCLLDARDNVLTKIFRSGISQSCDNLYVL